MATEGQGSVPTPCQGDPARQQGGTLFFSVHIVCERKLCGCARVCVIKAAG